MSRNNTKLIMAGMLAAVAITMLLTGHLEFMSGVGILAFFLLLI